MRPFFYLPLILCTLSVTTAWGGTTPKSLKVDSIKTLPPSSSKPHGPEKPMVEAWLDDTVLSIEFIEPQGEATLSLSNADVELESVTFSSEVPFVIDLTPYPDAETFTIETEFS